MEMKRGNLYLWHGWYSWEYRRLVLSFVLVSSPSYLCHWKYYIICYRSLLTCYVFLQFFPHLGFKNFKFFHCPSFSRWIGTVIGCWPEISVNICMILLPTVSVNKKERRSMEFRETTCNPWKCKKTQDYFTRVNILANEDLVKENQEQSWMSQVTN